MKVFRTWTFKWWQIGLVKLCLISLGLILGIYFGEYLSGLLWLWWVLFVATTLYFLFYMFSQPE